MKVFLSLEDQNRIASQIKKEIQELKDKLRVPGRISSSEKEHVIRDITSVTSRIDLSDKLPMPLKLFAAQHNIVL